MKKLFAKSAGIALITAISAASAQAAYDTHDETCKGKDAEVTLKVHHFLPEKAPAHTGLLSSWADSVATSSDCRIEVKVYGSMALGGKPPQLVDQVEKGFVDIIWTLPGYTAGRYPATSAIELPFMATDAEKTSMAFQAYYEANPEVQAEWSKVHPLFFWTHDKGVIYSKETPIKTVADFENRKLRSPTRTVTAALEALGATPVGMPVPDMPQALAKNVIGGTVVPFEIVPALRLHELVDYAVEIADENGRGLYAAAFVFAMNQKTYDKLSAENKAVIDAHSGMKYAQISGAFFKKAEDRGRELIDEKATRLQMSQEEVAKLKVATQDVATDWIRDMNEKGLNGQALFDSVNSLVDKYSK